MRFLTLLFFFVKRHPWVPCGQIFIALGLPVTTKGEVLLFLNAIKTKRCTVNSLFYISEKLPLWDLC
jgi:hypothetical protein